MVLVVAKHRPELLQDRKQLTRTFFHPSYLVESWELGIAGANLVSPQAKLGPDLAEVNICALNSDGEEIECPEPQPNASQSMLPPNKYTLENYCNNVRRGRPRTRRFRSSGALPSDGGAAPPVRFAAAAKTNDAHAVLDAIDFLDDL